MENASKALIIAGAILISILLISLGLLIFNSIKGTTDIASNLGSSLPIDTFNSQFTQYEGSNQKQEDILQLLSVISSSNTVNYNRVAVKLDGPTAIIPNGVMDSERFVFADENGKTVRCSSSNIVGLDTIKSVVANNPNYKFDVSFYYNNGVASPRDNVPSSKGCICIIVIKMH